MCVSTVGEDKGSVLTLVLPVRRAGCYSFPSSCILPLQPIYASVRFGFVAGLTPALLSTHNNDENVSKPCDSNEESAANA
jgi:cytochrome c biogenesis protein CcdA